MAPELLTPHVESTAETLSTHEVAQRLGLAVRSVQLMVDRGELTAWKTPGGHRRIERASVQAWLAAQRSPAPAVSTSAPPGSLTQTRPHPARTRRPGAPATHQHRVLLIEDSAHAVNLVRLLMQQHFPEVALHVAHNGVAGLITAGQIDPCVLIVDVLLPGIDGATLVTGLRTHPDFAQREILILTGLDAQARGAYAYALQDLPVIHKPQMVLELPTWLRQALDRCPHQPRAQHAPTGPESLA